MRGREAGGLVAGRQAASDRQAGGISHAAMQAGRRAGGQAGMLAHTASRDGRRQAFTAPGLPEK